MNKQIWFPREKSRSFLEFLKILEMQETGLPLSNFKLKNGMLGKLANEGLINIINQRIYPSKLGIERYNALKKEYNTIVRDQNQTFEQDADIYIQ